MWALYAAITITLAYRHVLVGMHPDFFMGAQHLRAQTKIVSEFTYRWFENIDYLPFCTVQYSDYGIP